MFTAEEKAKLRWRCRRGMLELDIFFVPFFEKCFEQLTESEQQTFAELLTCEDQDLYRWLLGYADCPHPQLKEILSKIQAYAAN